MVPPKCYQQHLSPAFYQLLFFQIFVWRTERVHLGKLLQLKTDPLFSWGRSQVFYFPTIFDMQICIEVLLSGINATEEEAR